MSCDVCLDAIPAIFPEGFVSKPHRPSKKLSSVMPFFHPNTHVVSMQSRHELRRNHEFYLFVINVPLRLDS